MKTLIFVFLAGCVASCVSNLAPKTSSKWYHLENSRKISCTSWPQRERDLRIDEITVGPGKPPTFFISGIRRNTAPFYYWVAYSGPRVNTQDFVPLDVPNTSIILGGAEINATKYYAFATNEPKKKRLIIKSLESGQPVLDHEVATADIVEGSVIKSRNGLWVIYKPESSQYKLAFVKLSGGKAHLVNFVDLGWQSNPSLVPSGAEPTALLTWRDEAKGGVFRTQVVREAGTFDQPVNLSMDTENVETWTSIAANKRLYVATIEGDTLVGEAVIKINEFSLGNRGFQLERSNKHVLNDTHTTEPRFQDGHRGLELLIMNWIDEESTIARYQVGTANPSKPLYSGIFPKGTRIMGGFHQDDVDVLLTRFRTGNQWSFQLCQL